MMDQKKNDWLAALFFQPDKSVQELVNLGITPDNSNVKDREYYKGIPEIQDGQSGVKGKSVARGTETGRRDCTFQRETCRRRTKKCVYPEEDFISIRRR